MNRLFEETIHRTEFPDEGLSTRALVAGRRRLRDARGDHPAHRAAGRAARRRPARVPGGQAPGLGPPPPGERGRAPPLRPHGADLRELLARVRGAVVARSVPDQGDPARGGAQDRGGQERPGPGDRGRDEEGEDERPAARGSIASGPSPSDSGSTRRRCASTSGRGCCARPAPKATRGSTTPTTIERLEIILTLTRDLGVNLAGVEVILHMKERMESIQGDVQQLLDRDPGGDGDPPGPDRPPVRPDDRFRRTPARSPGPIARSAELRVKSRGAGRVSCSLGLECALAKEVPP